VPGPPDQAAVGIEAAANRFHSGSKILEHLPRLRPKVALAHHVAVGIERDLTSNENQSPCS